VTFLNSGLRSGISSLLYVKNCTTSKILVDSSCEIEEVWKSKIEYLVLVMISDEDKKRLTAIAKKYNVSKLYLFGSTLDTSRDSSDIDLAVEGVPDSLFFKFYGELIFSLSKPIDLIDLKKSSSFNMIVKSEGVLLYG